MIYWTAKNMAVYIGQRGELAPEKKAANHIAVSRVQVLDARSVRDSLQLLVFPEGETHDEHKRQSECPCRWIAGHRFKQCEAENYCEASIHQGDTPERGTIRAHGQWYCQSCVEYGQRHVGECWDGTEPCEHTDCRYCQSDEAKAKRAERDLDERMYTL